MEKVAGPEMKKEKARMMWKNITSSESLKSLNSDEISPLQLKHESSQ